MNGELQRLKTSESRRPGGRRKNRAVKLSATENLKALRIKTQFGAYAGDYTWYLVLVLSKLLPPPAGTSVSAEALLLRHIGGLIKARRWAEFGRLEKMFYAADKLAEQNKGSSTPWATDQIRSGLIYANDVCYALNEVARQMETPDFLHTRAPKKAEILSLVKQSHKNEILGKADEDIYKMMRELGIPRQPDKKSKHWTWLVKRVKSRVRELDK